MTLPKSKMEQHAKGWKHPEQKREERRDSADAKGPAANAWKKSIGKQPKG